MEKAPMTSTEFAQATWDRLFQEKQGLCEDCYSAWMVMQERLHVNKKANQSKPLRSATEACRQKYYEASHDLHDWLASHPMPTWKLAASVKPEQPTGEAHWRREEKALRIALQSTLRRPLTDDEFENARSLFHYAMDQADRVRNDLAREREAAKTEKENPNAGN